MKLHCVPADTASFFLVEIHLHVAASVVRRPGDLLLQPLSAAVAIPFLKLPRRGLAVRLFSFMHRVAVPRVDHALVVGRWFLRCPGPILGSSFLRLFDTSL